MSEPLLKITDIRKSFDKKEILKGVSLEVKKGEVTVILGPSGSGKTTLLRTINFLEKADSGTVQVAGIKVDSAKPSKKDVLNLTKKTAFVFQNYNLFSNMTVLENVMAGLTIARNVNKKEAVIEAARNVTAELVPYGSSIDRELDSYLKLWNKMITKEAHASLTEDVNSLIRDYTRKVMRTISASTFTADRVRSLAEALVKTPNMQKIKENEALTMYVELYILRLLSNS